MKTVNQLVIALWLIEPLINEFFDNCLVMHEDEQVRNRRLWLLQRIVSWADGVADLSKLEGV